ncbi:hypothetical protein [Teredinibacter sp. KSP-S5-2]|uniref:hypothetical protein n=1 Tax=Teredinibacter sp. KSP-S5-2 TaxID=3034506 RepID=UPI002934BB1B|nr:hypothetical protein [Teredinibacter sp. KSP-S5-2]WNO10264.1 hypothetical protein P5V12_03660 [Teredinibacter sp. KSP-S5-2]
MNRHVCYLITLLIISMAVNSHAQTDGVNCSGLPDFTGPTVPALMISDGMVIKYKENAYQCKVAGWCNIWGPYTPGEGWAWRYAWDHLGHCAPDTSSSSSSSTTSSTSSTSSSSSSTTSSSSTSSSSSSGGSVSTRIIFADYNEPANLTIATQDSAHAMFSVGLSGTISFDHFKVEFIPPNQQVQNCAIYQPWQQGQTYMGNQYAIYKNMLFQAKWWTSESPASSTSWGAWEFIAACESAGIYGTGFSWNYPYQPGVKRYSKEYYFPVSGAYTLKGCAYDAQGVAKHCSEKTITAGAVSNQALHFASPSTSSPISAPINVDIDVSSGTTSQIGLYIDSSYSSTAFFQSVLSSPFAYTLNAILDTYNTDTNPIYSGEHALYAVGIDSQGAIKQASITVSVQ